MSNQNHYQNNYRDPSKDYGRRYREEPVSAVQDNYDVEPPVSRRQPAQNYGAGQQVPQDSRRTPQQYGQDYRRRQQAYPQNNAYPRRRDEYDDRYGYYDDRRYDDRYSGSYDRRYNDRYSDYDDRRRRAPQKRTSGGVIAVRVIAIILLLAGMGIVGYKLYEYYDAGKGHNELQALSQDFDQLYARNNDFFGWLKIDGTDVDYPVMYSPYDPEHYLHTDFDGDYSESGELFMDANCDPQGYHYLVYGHHMYNGSMFGSLPKYEDTDYFNEHRTFRFDTIYERGEYEVYAVLYSQVYDDDDDVFKYYDCANLNDEGTYNYYVSNIKALSIYDTGVTPAYGEKLVTLSTCNYHTEDGRFVVCARKIN